MFGISSGVLDLDSGGLGRLSAILDGFLERCLRDRIAKTCWLLGDCVRMLAHRVDVNSVVTGDLSKKFRPGRSTWSERHGPKKLQRPIFKSEKDNSNLNIKISYCFDIGVSSSRSSRPV